MKREQRVTDVAQALGVTRATVYAWAKRGAPHDKAADGSMRFDAEELREWQRRNGLAGQAGRPPIEDQLAREAARESAGAGIDDVEGVRKKTAAAKLAQLVAMAKLRQMEVEERKGELVARTEVEQATIARILAVRNALMALPARLTPLVVGQEARDVQDLIESECRRICDAFAEAPS